MRPMTMPNLPNPRQHTFPGNRVLTAGANREITFHFTTRTSAGAAGADITVPGTWGDFLGGSEVFRFEGNAYSTLAYLTGADLILWQPSTQLLRELVPITEVRVFSPGLANLTQPGALFRLGWNAVDNWYDNGATVPQETPGTEYFDLLDAKQDSAHWARIIVP